MNSADTKSENNVTFWRRFLKHRRIVQFLEYLVGGGVYFWGGLLVFTIAYELFHLSWFAAKVLADIVGWTANYVIQRYWAFNDSKLKGQDNRIVLRYVVIKGADLVIDYAIVASVVHFGITPYVGFFISAGFTTVWDYLWYRFWVFEPAT